MDLFYVLLITIIVIVLLLLLFYKDDYWALKNVPQEKPLPIVGNFLNLFLGRQNLFMLLESMCRKFKEPYYGLSIFNKHILIVKDPDLIKVILAQDFNKFENRNIAAYESADPIMYNTLFSMPNPKWRILRSKLSPLFSSGKIKMMLPLMVKCAEDMVKHVEENLTKTIDFKEVCSKYSTDIISSCAFGIEANSFKAENPEFHIAGKRMFGASPFRALAHFCYFFLPSLVPLLKIKFIEKRAAEFLNTAFFGVVADRKRFNIIRNDFVDHFYKLKEDSDLGNTLDFSDDLVVAQAIIFFIAGHESTSSLISFAIYELAVNKHYQDRLRGDIEQCNPMTYESINEITYLDMVIKETMRKYPFAPLISREASEDYVFEKTGLLIEKGTGVAVPLKGMHHDPEFFPNPDQFDPERFSLKNKSNITPYTFLPFGEGPRNCIGGRFGMLSAKIALIYVLKNFILNPSPETCIPIKFVKRSSFSVSENGIPLNVKKNREGCK